MDWTRGQIIGRGSSAAVSLATACGSGEVFAVKSIELSRSEFLQREQRILSLINCPQIVEYMGCDITTENGKPIYNIFMEYVAGGTLSDAIQKHGGRLDESMIRSYTRAILQGLEYLHSNGLVHCDMKGCNVLIAQDGAKIADLGCARWVDEVSGTGTSMAIPIAGTPVFMAPEVARGEEQGCPADVWALGCTVIEMATGRNPWPEVADPVSALYRIAFSGDVPEFPSYLSEQAKEFLGNCLRRDPKERWTVNQLLRHPFLDEPNSDLKQIQESTSNSPTSILDQDFWDSLEESETPGNLTHTSSSNSSAERIRRLNGGNLPSSPRQPNWTWNENWVTIRSNNIEISSSLDYEMMVAEEPTTSTGPNTASISHEEELESSVSSVNMLDCFISNILSSRKRSFEMSWMTGDEGCRRETEGVLSSDGKGDDFEESQGW
ncbi:hypothetical protein HHK36_005671 [Tetracentron sinense]|uniref:mitogen-activated protein kinase kinase kinase n=1 Tax=Tetracentron sinense TaxID=13715 RepID=A0A835DMI5_TETSI|nr:hypothetical protein HHK36_005671 [Tetracentron sinense]